MLNYSFKIWHKIDSIIFKYPIKIKQITIDWQNTILGSNVECDVIYLWFVGTS